MVLLWRKKKSRCAAEKGILRPDSVRRIFGIAYDT
jgi:hypothetical protein